MRKGVAIKLAELQAQLTSVEQFVVWDPQTVKESFALSGYQVKSEKELIEEFGSVEDYSLYVSYVAHQAS
jgi:hypothetical protein